MNCSYYFSTKDKAPSLADYIVFVSVCIVGSVCNLLAIIVLSRKALIKNPTNLFLIAISICGLIALIESFVLFVINQTNDKYTRPQSYGWIFILPCCYLICAIHTWLTVSIAAWRVATLDFPMQSNLILNRRNVLINMIIVVIIAIIFHIPHYQSYFVNEITCNRTIEPITKHMHAINDSRIITTPMKQIIERRKIKVYFIDSGSRRLQMIGFFVHSIAMQVIPCILLLIFTIILIKKLSDARKRKKKLMSGSAKGRSRASVSQSISNQISSDASSDKRSDRGAKSADKSVIETSHALILIFIFTLICDLPISIKIIKELITNQEVTTNPFLSNVDTLCNVLKLLDCSAVLILLSVTSSVFRQELVSVLKQIFICRSHKHPNRTQSGIKSYSREISLTSSTTPFSTREQSTQTWLHVWFNSLESVMKWREREKRTSNETYLTEIWDI